MSRSNNILHKVDWDVLNEYIENKLIKANKHPQYDIWILNYTPQVQAEKLWDIYTMSCRGLVVDSNGNILARPFKKFKNYEEYQSNEIDFNQEFEVYEKMDGSLIILFYYGLVDKWIVASRGSFDSDYSKMAENILNNENLKYLDNTQTYLFELITPENRIVVDYGDKRDLILLGVVNTALGSEMLHNEIYEKYNELFLIVPKINVNDFEDLLKIVESDDSNREGFVVRFENGFRVKLKFQEYVRIHAIVTNVSNLSVWKYLKEGRDFNELLDRVPDEFYNWLKKTIDEIQGEFDEIKTTAVKQFVDVYFYKNKRKGKEFAEYIKDYEYKSLLFCIFNTKNYNHLIWKRIRPVYSKPFQKET